MDVLSLRDHSEQLRGQRSDLEAGVLPRLWRWPEPHHRCSPSIVGESSHSSIEPTPVGSPLHQGFHAIQFQSPSQRCSTGLVDCVERHLHKSHTATSPAPLISKEVGNNKRPSPQHADQFIRFVQGLNQLRHGRSH